MKKAVKLLALLVGSLAVIIIAAVIIIPLVFDPNDYKDDIEAYVETRTGSKLTIIDDIKLSIFPWLGIELGKITIANPPGFGEQPLAHIDEARVKVKLLPLLKKQGEVDTVVIGGLVVNLVTNQQGQTNWASLASAEQATPVTVESTHSDAENTAAAAFLSTLIIGGIDIRNADLSWQDQQPQTAYALKQFNLKTGPLSLTRPVDISIDTALSSKTPAINGQLRLATTISVDLPHQSYRADSTRLETELRGSDLPGEKLDAQLQGDIAVDLEQQLLDIMKLKLSAMDVPLSGDIHGKQIIDNPAFYGAIQIDEFSPRQLLSKLGISAPETADSNVLKRASLSLKFDASTDHLDLQQLKVHADDTTLAGSVAVKNFASPSITSLTSIDDINLDRYLPPPSDVNAAATPASAATAGVIELPLETLRALNLEGALDIGKLTMANLKISDIHFSAKAKDGLIKLYPLKARLYGGSYDGNIALDTRSKVAAISLNEKLHQIQAGPLLQDLLNKDLMTGTADWQMQITTQGATLDDLRKTLNGNAALSFVDGGIKGMNLIKLLQEDYSKYARLMTKDVSDLDKTVFHKLALTVKIKNGLASTNDLLLDSAQLKVNGRGTANLVSQQLDMTLDVLASGQLAKQLSDLKGLAIPVTIKGSFTSPEIKTRLDKLFKARIDQEKEKIEAELKAKQAAAKAELEKKAAEEKAKLQQQVEQKKDEVEDKAKKELEKKLRNLFNR